jgi:serine/threonine-protein kinase
MAVPEGIVNPTLAREESTCALTVEAGASAISSRSWFAFEARGQSLREPMTEALATELARFQLFSVRLWQLLAVSGVFLGACMTWLVANDLGPVVAGLSFAFFLFTLVVTRCIRKHEAESAGPAPQLRADVVESSVPWAYFVAFGLTQGPEYAIASWLPPVLFCIVLFMNALRLRTTAVFVGGFVGAAIFLMAWFFFAHPAVADASAERLPSSASIQLTRFGLLVVVTVMCGLGAKQLRTVIVRAEGVVRSKDLFGKYRLRRAVGRGGMAEVIEALYCPEGGFQRRVAIKRIHPHLAERPRFVELFRSEAELCARLAHPNVVQVMDFGRIQDTYFLAMEFVDGLTLAQLLSRGDRRGISLPEHVAAAIATDLLEGLHHAHCVARGGDGSPLRIVHRDLCPQNILLSRNGEVKITDFGVARALKDAECSDTRQVVGHIAYLAPEQARAMPLDSRVDLWALGVILWEMLTGRRLFRRGSDTATVLAILNDPIPSVRAARPELSARWDALIGRALEREPHRRFQAAREMAEVLEAIPIHRPEGSVRELAVLVDRLCGDGGRDDATQATTTPLDAAASTTPDRTPGGWRAARDGLVGAG